MTPTLAHRLERLRNRRTQYEWAIRLADGREFLLFYGTDTNAGGYGAARNRLELINQTFEFDAGAMIDFHHATNPARAEVRPGHAAVVFLTGRTQRQAYIEGELPYYLDFRTPEEVPPPAPARPAIQPKPQAQQEMFA